MKGVYPPRSPYRFNVIGVELLGSIYERYLGNTIRTTAQQAHVEEKPEVRHTGGVYYTPGWVVRYIVAKTISPLLAKPYIPLLREDNTRSGFFELEQFQSVRDHLPSFPS